MMPNIFIPSYHRAENIKTVNYFVKIGYPVDKLHVVIDDEADDVESYKGVAESYGFNLHIFDMQEARHRYDYIHRPSKARRSAGQARNMFYDIAKSLSIDFYVVIDDDTNCYENRPFGKYKGKATLKNFEIVFGGVEKMMRRYHVGLFGLSQTGELFNAGELDRGLLRTKIMNTTFVLMPYVYRGERGIQDNDTSQFVAALNEGYFVASFRSGLVLNQVQSATAAGGLTDLYKECRLLNKSLVCPITYPSAIHAERQKMNGGRLHHRINYRYIAPKILRVYGCKGNIEYDAYSEDVPFTNEPKRVKNDSE